MFVLSGIQASWCFLYDNISYIFSGKDNSGSYYERNGFFFLWKEVTFIVLSFSY